MGSDQDRDSPIHIPAFYSTEGYLPVHPHRYCRYSSSAHYPPSGWDWKGDEEGDEAEGDPKSVWSY